MLQLVGRMRAASDGRSARIELHGVGCLARLSGRTRKRAPAPRFSVPSLVASPIRIGAPALRSGDVVTLATPAGEAEIEIIGVRYRAPA